MHHELKDGLLPISFVIRANSCTIGVLNRVAAFSPLIIAKGVSRREGRRSEASYEFPVPPGMAVLLEV